MGRLTYLIIGLIIGAGAGIIGMQLWMDNYFDPPAVVQPQKSALSESYFLCKSEYVKGDSLTAVRWPSFNAKAKKSVGEGPFSSALMVLAACSPSLRKRSAVFFTATAAVLKLAILRSTAHQVGMQALKPSREVGRVAFEAHLTVRDADIFQTGRAGNERPEPFPDFVRNDDLGFKFTKTFGGFCVSRIVGVALGIRLAPFF